MHTGRIDCAIEMTCGWIDSDIYVHTHAIKYIITVIQPKMFTESYMSIR